MSELKVKPLWRYIFPAWDGKSVGGKVGTALHYFALVVFVPLSIMHNLHGIESMEGLAYIWLVILVCLIDPLIATALPVFYELALAIQLILNDSEMKKALAHTPEARKYLFRLFRANAVIIGCLFLVMLAGTVALSVRGGLSRTKQSTNLKHQPKLLTSLKVAENKKHKAELLEWRNYYDSKIESEVNAQNKHLKSATWKGSVDMTNKTTKQVLATHSANIAQHEASKTAKLAELEKAHSKFIADLEKEHRNDTDNYQEAMESNLNFAETFVWGFSVLNIIFVLASLRLTQTTIETYLFPLLDQELENYLKNRSDIHKRAQKMRKTSLQKEREWNDIISSELKNEIGEREELEESKVMLETLLEINKDSELKKITLSDQTIAEIKALYQKKNRPNGNGLNTPINKLIVQGADGQNGQNPTTDEQPEQPEFFEVGEEIELDIDQALEALRTTTDEQKNVRSLADGQVRSEIGGQNISTTDKPEQPRTDRQTNPNDHGQSKILSQKKTLSDYEKSHALMLKYVRIEAVNHFAKGWTGRVQKGMKADANYNNESLSKGTISTLKKLLQNKADA